MEMEEKKLAAKISMALQKTDITNAPWAIL